MSKRGDKPRRFMTKVRLQVGKPTIKETPKSVYDRNEWKRETEEIIERACTCLRMVCVCDIEEEDDQH